MSAPEVALILLGHQVWKRKMQERVTKALLTSADKSPPWLAHSGQMLTRELKSDSVVESAKAQAEAHLLQNHMQSSNENSTISERLHYA